MQRIETKHAIVGAGAMGSAAAYHLARRGEPVLQCTFICATVE